MRLAPFANPVQAYELRCLQDMGFSSQRRKRRLELSVDGREVRFAPPLRRRNLPNPRRVLRGKEHARGCPSCGNGGRLAAALPGVRMQPSQSCPPTVASCTKPLPRASTRDRPFRLPFDCAPSLAPSRFLLGPDEFRDASLCCGNQVRGAWTEGGP